MNQTFINLRFEQIEKRFNEIEILLNLASLYQSSSEIYQTLCRSAHVLLVSHFEGLYREVCRDIIDDINLNTTFYEVKKTIFNSHCDYFIQKTETPEAANNIRQRLWEAFKTYPSKLRIEPFIYIDNKNPTPQIIETILRKFGVRHFFSLIEGSDLDLVFEDQKSKTDRLRKRLRKYVVYGTSGYPYTVDPSFYNPINKEAKKGSHTLWEDFINNFLKERHNIVHGHIIDNPSNHEALSQAKMKLEILLYAFIINICSSSNPLFLLSEGVITGDSAELEDEIANDEVLVSDETLFLPIGDEGISI